MKFSAASSRKGECESIFRSHGLALTIYSGFVTVAVDKNLVVVDSVEEGFGLYRLDSRKQVRAFPTGIPVVRKPKQVTFAENGEVVIGGSDHGAVYVFDRTTGAQLDVLKQHGTLIQAVAVRLDRTAYT